MQPSAPRAQRAPTQQVLAANIAKNKTRKGVKTRKAVLKRFRLTGSGKVMMRRCGKQHLNEKKGRKMKKRLSRDQAQFVGDVRI